jgi:hypothetical protein
MCVKYFRPSLLFALAVAFCLEHLGEDFGSASIDRIFSKQCCWYGLTHPIYEAQAPSAACPEHLQSLEL